MQLKTAATDLFKDTEEDSEVRIKAYLALVEKPCQEVADLIKDTLDREPVNQGKSKPVISYCKLYI